MPAKKLLGLIQKLRAQINKIQNLNPSRVESNSSVVIILLNKHITIKILIMKLQIGNDKHKGA